MYNFLKLSQPTKALIGIVFVIALSIIFFIYLGIQNFWFDASIVYKTRLHEGDGLRNGTLVTLSGLRVGEVIDLKVNDENEINVKFKIRSSFASKMKEGTQIRVVRSFVIGDKRLDIIPGPKDNPLIPKGGEIMGQDSLEITDLLSGKNIGEFTQKVESLLKGVNSLTESFNQLAKKVKPDDVVALYELLLPTLKKLNELIVEVNKEKSSIPIIIKSSSNILVNSKKQFFDNDLLFKTITHAEEISAPLAKNSELLTETLLSISSLTKELSKDPEVAKKMLSALNETILTLKAIQKTWILSDHVKEVEKESQK